MGTLLYHLLTGQDLSSLYPGGIFCHTVLHIPDTISVEARSLLKELLRHNASERIGSGLLGVEEIKSHPFFEGIHWDQIYNEGLLPF
ncbi:ribosomal protein S6 kinase delta-1-like [Macrosteles quadrilineatus]|uniref:ribosomal protein S6 kinase delta-1-like n=1 Tax=Macrosteles quadrilineatus TaxID=74068 RepID=UPI0023E277BB|nr:ribosomal protein S6 kinase delta-1-like [Macrosteles quadrilineatus]